MSPLSHKLKWYGTEAKAKERAGAALGLMLAGEHLAEMSTRLVPVEEGTLLLSVNVDVDARALKAAVSYDTPYAVRQHEELGYQHDEGRQAKYLETPLDAGRADGTFKAIIAAAIGESLRT